MILLLSKASMALMKARFEFRQECGIRPGRMNLGIKRI